MPILLIKDLNDILMDVVYLSLIKILIMMRKIASLINEKIINNGYFVICSMTVIAFLVNKRDEEHESDNSSHKRPRLS